MDTLNLRRSLSVLTVAAITAQVAWGAETDRSSSASRTSTGSAAQRATAARGASGKGPLPDPALLDGATQTAEKKSEYGMIGDFELPGDENAKNGKVGGQQNPNGGGAQGKNQQNGMPQGAGGGGGEQSQQQGGGAQGGAQSQQGGAQGQQGGAQGQQGGGQQAGGPAGGGGQAGGPENPNAAGNPVGGGGEAGAQAQGIQVAELGGSAAGQQGPAGGAGGQGGKPPTVAIGDKAMRIEPTQSTQGVVGQTQIADGHVQQHDKGTGTGGKGPSSPQGPGRIEKGRVIPAGL